MKKVFIVIAVMMMAISTMAQHKVAILETVDKSGKISYGVKLLLRSSLTSAISNTPGYEGYDRVDMASIAGEQEFQRTGNVSDNQIKMLGVATGAKYVLVAEAAEYDASNIIITAKILDVETFGVNSSAVQISGTSAADMRESCGALAHSLLKPIKAATPPTPASSQQSAVSGQLSSVNGQLSADTAGKKSASSILAVDQNLEKKGRYKSPGTAWFLSFLIPGTGQFYNGQWGKGFRFLFFTAACGAATYVLANGKKFSFFYDERNSKWLVDPDYLNYATLAAAGLTALVWIWNWIDAPVVASKRNKRNGYTLDLGERANLNLMPTMDYINYPLARQGGIATGMKLTLSF